MTTLKLGDLNINVALLQIRLGLFPTFYFDDRTYKAVAAFQKANRLKPDGVVGPLTQKALNLKPAPKNIAPNPLKLHLPIAQSQIGIKANTLPLFGSWSIPWKDNPRIVEYSRTTNPKVDNDEVWWCGSFVNWVMIASGREGLGRFGAAAKQWLAWPGGDSVTTPEPGDIVIVRKAEAEEADERNRRETNDGYHVGFYLDGGRPGDSYVRILGGNQSDQVKESRYLLAKDGERSPKKWVVKGYRRPRGGGNAIYLKLGNVQGNVTAEGYEGWMQIATLNFGVERSVSMEAGRLANRESGRPSLSRIALTRFADQSIAALLKESVTGAAGREAEIAFVYTGSKLQEYLRYKLSDCLVSNYAIVAHTEEGLVEGLLLSYSAIETTYRHRDATGKPGTPMRVGYSLKEAKVA